MALPVTRSHYLLGTYFLISLVNAILLYIDSDFAINLFWFASLPFSVLLFIVFAEAKSDQQTDFKPNPLSQIIFAFLLLMLPLTGYLQISSEITFIVCLIATITSFIVFLYTDQSSRLFQIDSPILYALPGCVLAYMLLDPRDLWIDLYIKYMAAAIISFVLIWLLSRDQTFKANSKRSAF